MADKEKNYELIDYIAENINMIKIILKKYEMEEDEIDRDIQLAAMEKKAEEIVESAIKINQDFLENHNEIALTYFESFDKLKKYNLFPVDFLDKFSSTAGFRNRLANDYMKLNEQIVIKSVKRILNLYPKYLEIMRKAF